MEIGTKVYLKPDMCFVVTNISTFDRIQLKSKDGNTSFYTDIKNVVPIEQPTCQPNIPTLKTGDLIITKPNAKSASGCQIGNMIGIVEYIEFDGHACTLKWIYNINSHMHTDLHNVVYISEIVHIHTPSLPEYSEFSSEFRIGDIIATGPNSTSIGCKDISNQIGYIKNIYSDEALVFIPLHKPYTSRIVSPSECKIIYHKGV